MKIRLVLAFSVLLLALTSPSQAGWGRGCGWGGGGWGYGGGWRGGFGGYCGPRLGWGGGYYGPGFGIALAAPVAVYRPVVYAPPAYYVQPAYSTRVVYTTRSVAQSSLVQAQAQLARLGYYRGDVDGSFGPLTSRAISLFQADNGLRVTGRLDSATLRSLGT